MDEFNGVNEIDDDELDFFKPSTSALSDIETYGPKMLCLQNQEELRMWGNYDSAHGRNLMIVFDQCNNTNSEGI